MGTEYAVKAETKEGNVLTLRRGFVSYDAAEDHPVQMKLWTRVWVERIDGLPHKAKTGPKSRKTREDFETEVEWAFIAIERAAVAGERCPLNGTHGVTKYAVLALAKAGRIRIDIYAHNWRVVTILTGPNAGKTTAKPLLNTRHPYVTVTKEGTIRRPSHRRVA